MHQNSPFWDPQSKNFLGRAHCPSGEGKPPPHTSPPQFSHLRRSTSAPRSMVPPMLNRNRRPWRQSDSVSNIVRVQSPSLPLSFPPPFPLKVAPLIQLGGLGSAVSSHSGVWAKPQLPTILVHIEGEETLLEAFKMHGFNFQTTENCFSLHFYEEIFQELTIAFILWSHYCEGPSHRRP